MRSIRLYLPKPLAVNTTAELSDEAAHHALHVLRLKAGDKIVIFNGEGGEYQARIASACKKSVSVQLESFSHVDRESSLHTHLAIGISRGERFDLALQKATELGVSEITPLITERTEVRLSYDRQDKVMQRWQKIIINACEQCYRTRLPKLNSPVDFSALVAQEHSECKLILHPPMDNTSPTMINRLKKPESACVLVGPEGGFSDSEAALAIRHHFMGLSLGPRILRTETAPLAALSVLQFVWGDIS